MTKSAELHLIHILECIERIENYTEGNRELFLKDGKTHDAVVRNLQTLAESTQKLPKNIKDKYPKIKWDKISGFRNILVHDYLGEIDPHTVLKVIDTHLSLLEAAVIDMLKQ